MSHQRYGARTGIARILRLLDRRRIAATFFIPGYSAERMPGICRSIRDAGHEIAHHGYLHEGAHGASPGEEETRLVRGLAALDEVLGRAPDRVSRAELGADLRDAGDPRPARLPVRLGVDGRRPPVRLAVSAEPGAPTLIELPGPLGARRLGALQLPARDHRIGGDREPGRRRSRAGRSSSRHSSRTVACSC